MKKLMFILLAVPTLAFANTEGQLERAPDHTNDFPALQHGAKIFVNYCLNCHGASMLRYNRLQDIGLTDKQIIDNLLFTADKIGEPMTIAMKRAEAKRWFGVAPPDLTVIARARASEAGSGADWLYTYLRGFYRDASRPSGWNNVAFPAVAMPNVLWELQGDQVLGADHSLKLVKPGTLTAREFDDMVGNLVGFLQWMGEPAASLRKSLGVLVLIALAVLFVFAYALKLEYWKDVH